jgi:hypothetical protein
VPVALTAACKGDFLRLLSSLIEYPSDGLVLDKRLRKKVLSKSSQAARKQPVEKKKTMDLAICNQTVQEMVTGYIMKKLANTGGCL